MKTLGLVGGTGWVSTVDYYRFINQGINKALGGHQNARCVMVSLNFGDIVTMNQRNDTEGIAALLLDAVRKTVDAIKGSTDIQALMFHGAQEEAAEIVKMCPAVDVVFVVTNLLGDPEVVPVGNNSARIVTGGKKGTHLGITELGRTDAGEWRFRSFRDESMTKDIPDSSVISAILTSYYEGIRIDLEKRKRRVQE